MTQCAKWMSGVMGSAVLVGQSVGAWPGSWVRVAWAAEPAHGGQERILATSRRPGLRPCSRPRGCSAAHACMRETWHETLLQKGFLKEMFKNCILEHSYIIWHIKVMG